jgi:hypothetical protein
LRGILTVRKHYNNLVVASPNFLMEANIMSGWFQYIINL